MDRNPPVVLLQPPDPSFAAPSSQSFDLSPVSFLLALLAVVTIPTLIYTFFLFIKCPPNPFRPSRRISLTPTEESTATDGDDANSKELVSGVKYRKESHVKEVGSECPVCLSVYSDGEEVRQLTVCKHSFHASCIDMWLSSHSNCPICRASVPGVKQRNNKSVGDEDDDLRQGLPDSASLV